MIDNCSLNSGHFSNPIYAINSIDDKKGLNKTTVDELNGKLTMNHSMKENYFETKNYFSIEEIHKSNFFLFLFLFFQSIV